MRLINRDAIWLDPVKKYLQEIFIKQGKTSGNCTGMSSMTIIGLTTTPVLFDAGEDEFYHYELQALQG